MKVAAPGDLGSELPPEHFFEDDAVTRGNETGDVAMKNKKRETEMSSEEKKPANVEGEEVEGDDDINKDEDPDQKALQDRISAAVEEAWWRKTMSNHTTETERDGAQDITMYESSSSYNHTATSPLQDQYYESYASMYNMSGYYDHYAGYGGYGYPSHSPGYYYVYSEPHPTYYHDYYYGMASAHNMSYEKGENMSSYKGFHAGKKGKGKNSKYGKSAYKDGGSSFYERYNSEGKGSKSEQASTHYKGKGERSSFNFAKDGEEGDNFAKQNNFDTQSPEGNASGNGAAPEATITSSMIEQAEPPRPAQPETLAEGQSVRIKTLPEYEGCEGVVLGYDEERMRYKVRVFGPDKVKKVSVGGKYLEKIQTVLELAEEVANTGPAPGVKGSKSFQPPAPSRYNAQPTPVVYSNRTAATSRYSEIAGPRQFTGSEVCRHFLVGRCNVPQCRFLHDRNALRSMSAIDPTIYFQRGSAGQGPVCPEIPPAQMFRKPRDLGVCRHFRAGKCNVANCKFRHTEDDLPDPDTASSFFAEDSMQPRRTASNDFIQQQPEREFNPRRGGSFDMTAARSSSFGQRAEDPDKIYSSSASMSTASKGDDNKENKGGAMNQQMGERKGGFVGWVRSTFFEGGEE